MKMQFFIIGLLLLANNIMSAQKKNTSAETQILPKGVVISNNKIVLKKGYSFKRVSDNEVNVINISTGLISGTFQCGCHTDTGGGSCTVQILDDSINCIPLNCNDCGMRTTIDPPKPDPLTTGTGGKTKNQQRRWVKVNIN